MTSPENQPPRLFRKVPLLLPVLGLFFVYVRTYHVLEPYQPYLPAVVKKCMSLQNSSDVNDRMTPNPHTDNCLLYHEPSPYIKLLAKVLVGTPIEETCAGNNCDNRRPYDEELRAYGNDWPPYGYTMIGKERLENFRNAIHEVDYNHINGAIVELGVWRGGAMIMANAITQEAQSGRDLYVFDAFESIPGYGESAGYLENSEDSVKANFNFFELLTSNVHFVKGLFKDTVPLWRKGTPIAVLRIDGNFYDSYADAMYGMYEDVQVGGIVIFDDVFTHAPVMRFWTDFKADHGIVENLNRIDKHSGWFRKTAAVIIDQSKKRAPQDVNKL